MLSTKKSGQMCSQLQWLYRLALALSMMVQCACATGPRLTDHAFTFDARRDSPDVEILDYLYATRKPEAWMYRETQKIPQLDSIDGYFPRGDSLYVKWRIKATGDVFEDTVDLRQRLPSNITRHRIYFIVKGRQLFVYLISPERRPAGSPPNGPKLYDYLKTITVYPDQAKTREEN